jgi:hypothetical protein
MPGYTQYYNLLKLYQGDPFSTNGYEYTGGDRDTIDRLLYFAGEAHHHTGTAALSVAPTAAATLALDTSQGSLPAATRVYYGYTYVDPNGFETVISPAAYIDLSGPVAQPGQPTVTPSTSAGTLPPGGYFYCVSAYVGANTNETAATKAGYATLTATGECVIGFNSIPTGASGLNIYRRGPNEANYAYLYSQAITNGQPTYFTDDGSYTESTNRYAPTTPATAVNNAVVVTLPAAPPTGFTWNLYRSFTSGDWTNARIVNIASGLTYTDLGNVVGSGAPPTVSSLIGQPSKVLLTGGAEVQGTLPASMVDLTAVFAPVVATFRFPGTLSVGPTEQVWVAPVACTIESVQLTLGPSSQPAAQPVIADVLLGTGPNPTYTTIYGGPTPNPKPEVPVAQQVGSPAQPNTVSMNAGDSLTCQITQTGGGATPSDHDLTVQVYLQTAVT